MIQPKDTVSNNFVYVKNKVIFNILDKDNGDSCAMELSESNVPHINVKIDEASEEESGTNKYFDSLIELGDIYSGTSFYKTVHNQNKNEEKTQTFQKYYYDACIEEIASLIIKINASSNEEFKRYLKGNWNFPVYMVSGMGYVVEGIDQINLTDAKYKELKENKLKELALNAASNLLNSYNYEIASGTIDIKEKE